MFQTVKILALLLSFIWSPISAYAEASGLKQGVTDVLKMQSEAWNRGDLDKFLTGYVRSDQTSYISAGVEVRGYEALRERYQKKYGQSRDTMGTLSFSDLDVSRLGSRSALCLGHWSLDRKDQPRVSGMFSLVLRHEGAGWRILHDHTSTIETK